MDIAKLFSDLTIAVEEMKKPMSIEEAIKYIDPTTKQKELNWPDDYAALNAILTKARMTICDYARKKLKEDNAINKQE